MPDLPPARAMPDYTNPDDPTRLRANASDRGWLPDRDDPDAAKLRELYARMDRYVSAWNDPARSDMDVSYWGDSVALCWSEIRATQRGN